MSGDGPQDAAALAKIFQDALVNVVRPPAKEEEVCVDFASKMSKLKLDVWFPDEVLHVYFFGMMDAIQHQVWPPMNAVNELAAKMKKGSKKQEHKPFLFVDLKKSVHTLYILSCLTLSV